jgi:hypothetical protein
MLGIRLDEGIPVVSIAEDRALSIRMLNYHGYLRFGLCADRAALPGAAWLPDLLADEVGTVGDPVSGARTSHKSCGAGRLALTPS